MRARPGGQPRRERARNASSEYLLPFDRSAVLLRTPRIRRRAILRSRLWAEAPVSFLWTRSEGAVERALRAHGFRCGGVDSWSDGAGGDGSRQQPGLADEAQDRLFL